MGVIELWEDTSDFEVAFDNLIKDQVKIAKIDIGGLAPVYSLSEKVDSNGYYLINVS